MKMSEISDKPLITTLVVCVNKRFRIDQRSCFMSGSANLATEIEAQVRARSINVKIERSVCFGHCQQGPVMRLVPGGKFFHDVTNKNVDTIVDELEEACGLKPVVKQGTRALSPD